MKEGPTIQRQVCMLKTSILYELRTVIIINSLTKCVLTGMFTAPVNGRYFFSAVLTGHKNVKIEAVLSRSNYGIARGDSAGYQPEGLEKPMAEARHTPGSLVIFNIILPLQEGETVYIDLVTGQLADSVEPLTIFSGMLLYEETENR